VYGVTGSQNFPVTIGAYDNSFNGGIAIMFVSNGSRFPNGTDIYLTKFNFSGTALLASTYYGGSGNDGLNHSDHYSAYGMPAIPPATGNVTVYEPNYDSLQYNYGDQSRGEIMVDAANNIYIASSTRSGDLPTANAFDNTLGGTQDGLIAKFNTNLSTLLYASYIGGSSTDAGYGIIVKNNLEAYVTGGTCSSNFPWSSGGYQSGFQGGKCDAYVIRVSASGSQVLNGTYFGTNQYDQAFFIQSDKYNNVYIYGQSLGNTPVVIAQGAATIFSVSGTHQFIARFNQSLNVLNMATKFGNYTNTTDISPCAFAVDKCNNLYLSGWGGNILTNGPVLQNMPLFQPTQANTTGFDFYFMGLDSNAAALKYGSYFGGSTSREHVDGGTSRFDPMGKIYQSACAGCWGNQDWPVTPGAWPGGNNPPNGSNFCNNGVVKLDFQLQIVVATINTNTLAGCAPLTVTFTNGTPPSNLGATYMWYLGAGQTTSTNPNPSVTYTTPGIYTVALVVRDNLTCNKIDSNLTFISVSPGVLSTINVNYSQCSNTVSLSNSSTGNLGSNPYQWNLGNGNTSTLSSLTYSYPSNGSYNITFTVTDVNGCKDMKTAPVTLFNFTPSIVNGATICSGSNAFLNSAGGTSYSWSPPGNLNNPQVSNPTASPTINTVYSVQVFNNSPGYTCVKTLTTQVNVFPSPNPSYIVAATPCSNTVALSNTTGNFNGSLAWDLGDGTSLPAGAPFVYTYTANGIYTITLNATDNNGCLGQMTRTVAIFDFQPAVSGGSLCFGDSRQLVAQGGTGYTWTPSIFLNNSLVGNPQATPTISTDYTVNILNNTPYGFGCSRTLTTSLEVKPTPTADFGYTSNPCGGGIGFYDKSSEDIASWNWTLSPTRTSTVQNPYYFYQTGGHFTVALISTNIYGCRNKKEMQMDVGIPPPLSISNLTQICKGSKTGISASGGIAYHWWPENLVDMPYSQNPVVSPLSTTEFSVLVSTSVIVGGKNCEFILQTVVEVIELSGTPVSGYANPTLVTVGDASTLHYVGDPGAEIFWMPANSTKPSTGYTVVAYPDRPTTYTAYATKGPCKELVLVHVDAYTEGCVEKDAFIPNTFTPNGDGQNDVLYVRGVKVDEMYFSVYNRWGEKVFESHNKQSGWDGVYQGKPAEAGVYGWYLKAKCVNGLETFLKGNVTLVR
jgi:gliding motility-associated-like protein